MESLEKNLPRLKELVLKALERPQDERRDFLLGACGNDQVLLGRAMTLVELNPVEDNPLDRGAVPEAVVESCLEPGTRVGAYRICERIGRGGMGEVYRAERADDTYRKSVAIKVLKHRGLSSDFHRRFLAERQTLADLEHPLIVRLTDAGQLSDGRPYLVMAYVEGEPLGVYCQSREIGLTDRVRLILEVCKAVGHAHQRLIVHRDLKPANILVTEAGQPQLLDFGVSKHLREGSQTPETRWVTPITPDYASPEQLLGLKITTAVDVYSLGVILYELLVDQNPFAVDGWAGRNQPRPPSAFVEGLDLEPSERRRRRRRLEGDLDAIVLRALAPEAGDRYPTVEALASDLDRYLQGLPIDGRQGRWYRLRKLAQREWKGLTAVAVMTILSLGLGLSVWQRKELERQNLRIVALSDSMGGFLVDLFEGADPRYWGQRNPALEAVLDQGSKLLGEGAFEEEPQTRTIVLASIGQVYRQAGRLDEAEALLREALALRKARTPEDPLAGLTMSALGNLLRAQGRLSEGRSQAEAGLRWWRRHYPGDDSRTPALVSTLAGLDKELGHFDLAIGLFSEALAMKRRLAFPPAEIAKALKNLASAQIAAGDFVEAGNTLREARRVLSQSEPIPAGIESGLLFYEGVLSREVGKLEMARAALEESLKLRQNYRAPQHRQVLELRVELARLERLAGHPDRALEWLEPVLETLRGQSASPVELSEALIVRAEIVLVQGDLGAGLGYFEEALQLDRGSLPEDHWRSQWLEGRLADLRATDSETPTSD